jgi:hypothetical protein
MIGLGGSEYSIVRIIGLFGMEYANQDMQLSESLESSD